MGYITAGRAAAAGAVLALGLAVSAPAAVAHHNRGDRLCSNKYDGTYKHWGSEPILGPRGRLGRISYNYRTGYDGNLARLCVVTVREHHRRSRYTGVRIKSVGAGKWRRDASRTYRYYAGPVVRALWATGHGPPLPSSKRLRGRGTIGRAYCKFSLRILTDPETKEPLLLRLRSRCTAPDGHATGRRTFWLNV
jgi:hypothetical protein